MKQTDKRRGDPRGKRLLGMVSGWAAKIGDKEAMKRLIVRGVGLATSEKIVHGRYHSTPKSLLSTILEEELSKDGFNLDKGA